MSGKKREQCSRTSFLHSSDNETRETAKSRARRRALTLYGQLLGRYGSSWIRARVTAAASQSTNSMRRCQLTLKTISDSIEFAQFQRGNGAD
jgi:hypothetical protein